MGKKVKRRLELEDKVPSLLDAVSPLHPGVMLLLHILGGGEWVAGGSQRPVENSMGLHLKQSYQLLDPESPFLVVSR